MDWHHLFKYNLLIFSLKHEFGSEKGIKILEIYLKFFLVGAKKIGEKYWSGAKKSGENLVGEKFSHPPKNLVIFPDFFFPDKVFDKFD